MSTSSPTSTALKAEYKSPTSFRNISHCLPSCTSKATKDKCAYLSALRASVVRLQDEVNQFLTEKMEEDKAKASSDGLKEDDRQAEENYGEEIVDEDG